MDQQLDRLQSALADRYAIERALGAGGMATVYLAEDLRHHRKVAIKVLRPELAATLGSERFLREIEVAAQLTHPHILPLHDSGEADGFVYYVMPYIEGLSLREKLEREGELAVAEAVKILREVVDALACAHKHGLVHRDIKPENVMLSGRHALVMDFGIAKAVSNARGVGLTRAGVPIGTPAYMPPEQASGDPHVDHRADIYAVGVLAHELLTGGRPPLTGATQQTVLAALVTGRPKPTTARRGSIPPELAQLVIKCLEKEPSDRWQNAEDLLTRLEVLGSAVDLESGRKPLLRRFREPIVALPAIVLFVSIVWTGLWLFNRAKLHWAREEAIPEIIRLAAGENYSGALALARQVEKYIPGDSILVRLLPEISVEPSIHTTPQGADVYLKNYEGVDDDWQHLGRSPIDNGRIARGYKRIRITKNGFATQELARFLGARTIELSLSEEDSVPPGMVRVPGGVAQGWLTGIDPTEGVELRDFFIDKYEVTNRHFRKFVDSGGYERREFWKHDFVKGGRAVSWELAMAEFRDATGRPGPATWTLGDFPDGHDDHPVTGVSWYEAAAYAEFAGKSLPTIYHWTYAAGTRAGSYIIPLSNFGTDGTAAAGSYQGMSPVGAYDMAGNVKEWVWNESQDQRYILGGAWNEPTYQFHYADVQSPFDRAPTNGFRCVRYLGVDGAPENSSRPVKLVARDYDNETPVTQAIFEVYKNQFSYDNTEMNAIVERRDELSEDWTREKITFDAAYGDERVTAYVFLPTRASAPYQTVVVFPGSDAIGGTKSESIGVSVERGLEFIAKSGRALLYPIYDETYERNDGLASTWPNQTHAYIDHVTKWVMDLRRSIDYLETRSDIDVDRLAYFGVSWGGRMGAIVPAVEDRLKASVLYSGGLAAGTARPEVDQINFITRVKIPVLMLNGRFDSIEPVGTAQLPMFRLFGTPEQHKRHVIYETGHLPLPRNAAFKEVIDWLDRYLGPVQ